MKKRIIAVSLVLLLTAPGWLMGCSSHDDSQGVKESEGTTTASLEFLSGDADAGYEFVEGCTASCHSRPTPGNFAPLTEDEIVAMITNHYGMPFPEEEAYNIAAWALS